MTSGAREADNGRVLAVLVLYGRALEEATSWPAILTLLGGSGALSLVHVLIYDNSSESRVDVSALPPQVEVYWTGQNRGTAGAYVQAIECAQAQDCDWLLLLDQDTHVPAGYLQKAEQAVGIEGRSDVLVPRIRHGDTLVSPATITSVGSVRPTENPDRSAGIPTAISSGLLVKRKAIEAALPFPDALWLDYVDHWMFLSFERQRKQLSVIDIDLQHDLSVRTPRELSAARLESILVAEGIFYRQIPRRAQRLLAFRRGMRAGKFLIAGRPDLAWITALHMLGLKHRS